MLRVSISKTAVFLVVLKIVERDITFPKIQRIIILLPKSSNRILEISSFRLGIFFIIVWQIIMTENL